MPSDVLRRGGLIGLAITLGLVATSCGGGGSNDSIKIAFVTDCTSPISNQEAADAGAELPFLQRGAKLRGSGPLRGVTETTVSGKRIQLLLGCESYPNFTTLLGALRQLVGREGADIVVGPNNTGEGLVVKYYARHHLGVTFSAASGEQSTTLKTSTRNLFSFVPDAAQSSAGLGTYAYRKLGWRNAATVMEDDPYGWASVAGFVAEFCSLGGTVQQVRTPTFDTFGPVVARIPTRGVDGVVLPSSLQSARRFVKVWARRYPNFGRKLLVSGDSDAFARPLMNGMRGLVGVSTWPFASTVASRRFRAASRAAFPRLGEPADYYSYDAMEPMLEALDGVHGDLSNGERPFQKTLAGLTFHAPNGTTTLDPRHQAVVSTYLGQVERSSKGNLFVRQIRVVPKVEQTFGGYFGPGTPPPGRNPVCKRRTPPAWASPTPATR